MSSRLLASAVTLTLTATCTCMLMLCMALAGRAVAEAVRPPAPRVVLTFLVDDLGFWDSSVYNSRSVTPVLRSLADEGVRLSRMYTYKYCSPTRRSFLSGRFPVHLSGAQAPVCSNYLPLNVTLLSQKLQTAGVVSHFIGKGRKSNRRAHSACCTQCIVYRYCTHTPPRMWADQQIWGI